MQFAKFLFTPDRAQFLLIYPLALLYSKGAIYMWPVGTFVSTALIFGLKWKIRPFLEMAFRARSAGQIGFLIGGRFWRFLAIFGDFWWFLVIFWLFSLNCAPQCCSKGGFQYNFRRPIRCRAQLDTRTPSRGPKLGSFGIFGAFCYILAAFLLISANID